MRHLPGRFSDRAPRPLERILVGVALDGSDERVLAAAAAIGRTTGARLTIVHATEPMDGAALLDAGADMTAGGNATLTASVDRWVPPDVVRTVEVLPGPAHRVLTEVAARTSPGLVLVGASGDAATLLGSTAERVVRKASVPVLVVRDRLAEAPRRVVAPVDLSDLSASGFRCGLTMASQLAGGAELHVVAPFAIGFLDPLSREMREQGSTTAEMTRRARARLAEVVDEHVPDVALDVEKQVVLGPARDVILSAAKLASADLIVMSTHGHGGFERLVLGSVAATVVREAPCSVLLVPPEAAFCDEIAEAILSQTAPSKRASL
jgi:nucleotide-binding universal stress UspA family protein